MEQEKKDGPPVDPFTSKDDDVLYEDEVLPEEVSGVDFNTLLSGRSGGISLASKAKMFVNTSLKAINSLSFSYKYIALEATDIPQRMRLPHRDLKDP